MRAFLKGKNGTILIYAKKEDWKNYKCPIHKKHKTPFEAFKCYLETSIEYSGYEIVWVKEK